MIAWIKRGFFSRQNQGWVALLCLVMSSATGCDWIQNAFMNSIPFKGDPKRNPEVNVYLGVDGLSYHLVQEAMAKGELGHDWKLAKLITAFPGTSDYSWTRTLHTKKLGGYEIEYYSPEKDELEHSGLLGLMEHLTPTLFEFMSFEFEYLKAFDWRGNGYAHAANAYGDTFVSYGDTLDQLFFQLSGRIETSQAFSAYILEFDVMGHILKKQDAAKSLKPLLRRIEEFRKRHSERRVNFTIFSDHGMDFLQVPSERMIKMDEEFEKVGIEPVKNLRGHDPKVKPFAIPVMHTLVTYLAVHTVPELIDEVAGRTTNIPSVDLAVAKSKAAPQSSQTLQAADIAWYNIWAEGKVAVQYGFDSKRDEYYLLPSQDYARIDAPFENAKDFTDSQGQLMPFKIIKDDELFAIMKHKTYPDIFYRARTSISTVAIEHPAEIMVSFRPNYASLGFTLPGNKGIPTEGFHGSMEQLGTLGTLLTTEKDIPDAVRADTLMDMFPKFKDHLRRRGLDFVEGDPNASLNY